MELQLKYIKHGPPKIGHEPNDSLIDSQENLFICSNIYNPFAGYLKNA